MYGENGGLMRAELSALLRQHRIRFRGWHAARGVGRGQSSLRLKGRPDGSTDRSHPLRMRQRRPTTRETHSAACPQSYRNEVAAWV
jgi:hypothetical protein